MTARWHISPTLAGKPGGRVHYDIGADDNENIALVYPAEDGPGVTVKRARRIAAANPLFTALEALLEGDSVSPWWWLPVPGGGRCAMCECALTYHSAEKQHGPNCPVQAGFDAIDLAERGDA